VGRATKGIGPAAADSDNRLARSSQAEHAATGTSCFRAIFSVYSRPCLAVLVRILFAATPVRGLFLILSGEKRGDGFVAQEADGMIEVRRK